MVAVGLHPGASVTVEGVSSLDGTVELNVRGSRVSLAREDAAMVFVKMSQ
jgi:Fe2+ transport system protein FeoA